MTRRTWDSTTKAQIVMEGLKGRAVASICAEYGINQALYYKWRDTFLQNADKAFEPLQRKNKRLNCKTKNSSRLLVNSRWN